MAVGDFALLVGTHPGKDLFVRGLVVLDRDERGHATHRHRAALVAGLAQQLGVAVHAVLRHVDHEAVGHHPARLQLERLDHAEDVVPAAAVEANHMVAQFVEDLVHLEGCGQRLDEYRGLDGAAVDAKLVLRRVENVVPEPRFQVGFDLGQIEIRPGAVREQRLGVMEEEQREIDNGGRGRGTVDAQVAFDHVPATGPHDERGP